MENNFFKPFSKDHPYEFRLTKIGYLELKHRSSEILKTIHNLINSTFSYNDIIAQSYDYLERIIPGFFEAFCNVYFKAHLIDNRITPISIMQENRFKLKIENTKDYNYVDYFYNNRTKPSLYIQWDEKNDKICPVGIVSIKILLSMIVNIINSNYEDLFVAKSFISDNLLAFKHGIVF